MTLLLLWHQQPPHRRLWPCLWQERCCTGLLPQFALLNLWLAHHQMQLPVHGLMQNRVNYNCALAVPPARGAAPMKNPGRMMSAFGGQCGLLAEYVQASPLTASRRSRMGLPRAHDRAALALVKDHGGMELNAEWTKACQDVLTAVFQATGAKGWVT